MAVSCRPCWLGASEVECTRHVCRLLPEITNSKADFGRLLVVLVDECVVFNRGVEDRRTGPNLRKCAEQTPLHYVRQLSNFVLDDYRRIGTGPGWTPTDSTLAPADGLRKDARLFARLAWRAGAGPSLWLGTRTRSPATEGMREKRRDDPDHS